MQGNKHACRAVSPAIPLRRCITQLQVRISCDASDTTAPQPLQQTTKDPVLCGAYCIQLIRVKPDAQEPLYYLHLTLGHVAKDDTYFRPTSGKEGARWMVLPAYAMACYSPRTNKFAAFMHHVLVPQESHTCPRSAGLKSCGSCSRAWPGQQLCIIHI